MNSREALRGGVSEPFPLGEAEIVAAQRSFLLQKDYPCIGALRALQENEIRSGIYRDFGSGESGSALRVQLERFHRELRENGSDYLTFWAIFDGPSDFSEEDFERRLWRELACLTSAERKGADWGNHVSDPESREFSFCLFGEPFFVVGLHPGASRRGRRFPRPSLVFNAFRQFASLQRKGAYDPMVRVNRRRDTRFDGGVNPMALAHGEQWEAIQFSGRQNSRGWKCPFRFLHGRKKSEPESA